MDNFKSLINVTFSPRECNLLLGVNNAGKTNLCQAMTFLAATVRAPLNDCADSVQTFDHAITAATVAIAVLRRNRRHWLFAQTHPQPNSHAAVCFLFDQQFDRPGGLWAGPIRTLASARAPPRGSQQDPDQARELQLVLDSELLQAEYLEAQAAEPPELQLVLDPEFL